MLKRILVPLDGSRMAERAIPLAARLARASGGTIVFVRLIRAPVEYESALLSAATWLPAADPRERDEAALYLAEIDSRAGLSAIATELHVYAGPASELIGATARARGVDLIVMTSRGQGGLARMVLGSVARAVVRTAGVPVLVLRDEETAFAEETAASGAGTLASSPAVLVALDGSPLAEEALRPAIQLALALSRPGPAHLHLLRVMNLAHDPDLIRASAGVLVEMANPGGEWEAEREEAEAYLSALAGRLLAGEWGERDLAVTWSVARGADVAGAIVRGAEECGGAASGAAATSCDLIALATHGRGGLRRWILGSVTEEVLRRTRLPVLSVRPRTGLAPVDDADAEKATAAESL